VSDALDARKNPIIIDNTFVQQWEREQYMKLVCKHRASTYFTLCISVCAWLSEIILMEGVVAALALLFTVTKLTA